MTEEDRQLLKGLTEAIKSLESAISRPQVVQHYSMPLQHLSQPIYPYPQFYPANTWGLTSGQAIC